MEDEVGKFADRRVTHPSTEMPILTWWKGIYDHAYIAPHPFVRVQGFGGLGSKPYPSDDAIKSMGEAVSWSTVHRSVAPERTREEVFLAIWLLSVLGFVERADVELQKRIENYCQKERLYLPEEFGHSSIMEPSIGRFLSQFDVPSVAASDEFRDNVFELPLSDFDRNRPAIRLPKSATSASIWGLHVPDPGILLTWAFESTEIIIGMTDRALKLARPEDFFDGWYADERSYSDVHNPADFLTRRA